MSTRKKALPPKPVRPPRATGLDELNKRLLKIEADREKLGLGPSPLLPLCRTAEASIAKAPEAPAPHGLNPANLQPELGPPADHSLILPFDVRLSGVAMGSGSIYMAINHTEDEAEEVKGFIYECTSESAIAANITIAHRLSQSRAIAALEIAQFLGSPAPTLAAARAGR